MATARPAKIIKMPVRERMLTVKEFAAAMCTSVPSVHRWIAGRQVTFVKLGPAGVDAKGRDRRAVRIPESEVDRLTETKTREI